MRVLIDECAPRANMTKLISNVMPSWSVDA